MHIKVQEGSTDIQAILVACLSILIGYNDPVTFGKEW
jgi:hypothetical protein